jgi:hypothetical protein
VKRAQSQLYTDDVTGLFAAVLAAPGEKLPQGVLADALDECGEHDLAHCFRWCAAHGRVPLRPGSPARRRYVWVRGAESRPDLLPEPHYLPKPLAALMSIGPTGLTAAGPWLCYWLLAEALRDLAALAALPPDDPTPRSDPR